MSISVEALKNLQDQFLNEEVIIYLNNMRVAIPDPENQQISVNAMVQGVFLNVDQDYIHMGLPDGTIIRSVKHDLAGMIEVLIPSSPLMDMNFPETDEEVH